jgi:hypothetical protein
MYEAVKKKDNEKLGALKGQVGEMGAAYDEMVRAREEAKKQLDAKFEDVYNKLQANRDFTIAEGKRVNDTLRAFQEKFSGQLRATEDKLREEMEKDKKQMREQAQLISDGVTKVEKALEDEKADRLRQSDENLKPIKENIASKSVY